MTDSRFVFFGRAGFWLSLVFLFGCEDDTSRICTCPGSTGGWASVTTWPAQAQVRLDHWNRLATDPRPSTPPRVDLLRGAVILGLDRSEIPDLDYSGSWQERLLVGTGNFSRGAEPPVEAISAQLETLRQSASPVSVVEESAIRANLAAAIVRDAIAGSVVTDALLESLQLGLSVVEGHCGVPEAVLNESAIRLLISDVLGQRGDRESSVAFRLAAEEVLDRIVSEDPNGCSDGPVAFFGTQGTGERYAYVIDKSASMDVPGGFDQLKRRLRASIRGLSEDVAFSLIFFSEVIETASGEQVATSEFLEIPVPPFMEDDAGMFRRSSLGGLNGNEGMRWLEAQIEAVRPDGSTYSDEALLRAISLEPTTIFLLTDAALYDDQPTLERISESAKQNEIRVNTVLFLTEGTNEPSILEEGMIQLERLSSATGGVSVIVENGVGNSIPETNGRSIRFERAGETFRDRALRSGLWTPVCERQYLRIASAIASRNGNHAEASDLIGRSFEAPPYDVLTRSVTMADETDTPEWPRTIHGSPLPIDGMGVFEQGLEQFLAGDSDGAISAFEKARVIWAACMHTAVASGRADDARRFEDLACRSTLFETFVRGERSSRAATEGIASLEAVGIKGGSSWSRQLLAAGGGSLGRLRASLALWAWSGEDEAQARAEYDLSLWFFDEDEDSAPLTEMPGFEGLSETERRFFEALQFQAGLTERT